MSREWKPGDVVTATVKGRENVRLVAGWSRYDPQLRWCEMSPRWGDGDDDECWFMPRDVTDHRPLVVIDPEDREQVERLLRLQVATYAGCPDVVEIQPAQVTHLCLALREFANPTPPKLLEPQGLGAVVEDKEGHVWIRTADTDCRKPWSYANNFSDDEWGHINAVRVLSEGVTP